MKPRKLKWGQTPWDELPREDLLLQVQRLYSALNSTRSALKLTSHGQERSPFWSIVGTGGRALHKADQALDAARMKYTDGDLFGIFFRYADDLLFGRPIGYGWMICPAGHLTARTERPAPVACVVCPKPNPEVRPIAWRDLKPSNERKGAQP